MSVAGGDAVQHEDFMRLLFAECLDHMLELKLRIQKLEKNPPAV
jgi:hypothetical protein